MKRPALLLMTGAGLLWGHATRATEYDFWISQPGTTAHVDLIPADFFGPGSDPILPFDVTLESNPFGPGNDPGKPANADTSIARSDDPQFGPWTGNPEQAAPVDTSVYALSLISTQPITVTYDGLNPEQWNVRAETSDTPQPVGSLVATRTHENGGVFNVWLYVLPKLIFTRVSDAHEVVLDPAPQVNFATFDAPFSRCVGSLCGFFPGTSQLRGRDAPPRVIEQQEIDCDEYLAAQGQEQPLRTDGSGDLGQVGGVSANPCDDEEPVDPWDDFDIEIVVHEIAWHVHKVKICKDCYDVD